MTSPFRDDFAFYQAKPAAAIANTNTVYLDSAATSQRAQSGLDAMQGYHSQYNANVHRGGYALAQKATAAYEEARATIAELLGAQQANQIVFTSGATAALNIIANGLQKDDLKGNKIVLCISEHHANLLPWQQLAQRYKLHIEAVYLNSQGQFLDEELEAAITCIDNNTALVAFAHVSNVLGNIYPVKTICEQAKKVQAISVIDGTQAAAHIPIDVSDIDCDFYVISGHKMYASTGIGALYGKYSRLEALSPSILGGEMIKHVTINSYELQEPPLKFEAGTPNIAGAIGFAAAARFCMRNLAAFQSYENSLYDALLTGLNQINQIQIWGNRQASIPLVSFSVEGVHSFDIANALAHRNIAVRAGHHCAMPLLQSLKIDGCLRVSLACYNTHQEIDVLLNHLKDILSQLALSDSAQSDANCAVDNTSDQKRDNLKQVTTIDTQTLSTDIEQQLLNASDWNEKHRLLLLYSKKLPLLATELRSKNTVLDGCEARVWLAYNTQSQMFTAYSDSKVVRGLLSLLLNKSNTLLPVTRTRFDFIAYLTELGLTRYFSQGRKDGMLQIINRVKTLSSV